MKLNKWINKAKKPVLYFCCSFLFLSLVHTFKVNQSYKMLAEEQIKETVELWKEKDLLKVSEIAKIEESSFEIKTGFEEITELQEVLDEYIYESVDYKINAVSVNSANEDTPIVKAKVTITNYNNLEVLKTVINQLIQTDIKVDINYNFNDFIKDNIESIKKACQSIKKDYEKVVIVNFTYDNQFYLHFEDNKEFYNALSGNMLKFKEEVKEIDVKI